MSKKDLQRVIRKEGAFILSDGTLHYQHLLAKAYDLIKSFNIRDTKGICKGILECFEFTEDFDRKESGLFNTQYWGWAKLKQDDQTQLVTSDIWNEDVFNFFNDIAPAGYYFGSQEGDGACIGWFKWEEE